ncbi:Pre-mRNA-splicing factor cwf19 [Coemansia sp. RSA 988]|nr:Pre-mRNA-splicing factor cwf19 [Coemansia sp. RSA 988]
MGDSRRERLSSKSSRDKSRGSRSRSPTRSTQERQHRKKEDGRAKVVSYGTDLNKLRAKVLKARIQKSPELAQLEKQLADAMKGVPAEPTRARDDRSDSTSKQDNVVVLPQVDSHGRLLSTGRNKGKEADSDELTIKQMARIERETQGENSGDRELASQIAKDTGFTNDLDYIDDNSERLLKRKTIQSDNQKKQAAIRDYNAMETVLRNCDMCFKQTENSDGTTLLRSPEYPMVALGNRVGLMLPNCEPMNDGHCMIAPIEHMAGGTLKCDDDMWDEIGNFMKSLMRMFAERRQGVVFMETVLSVQPSRAGHCMIECIPLPIDKAADAAGYFKEALLSLGDEWSQNRKVIDTRLKAASVAPQGDNVKDQDGNHRRARDVIRRGGFRNTMTSQLAYFHVWFDPHGGIGHVIETPDAFPRWFGREVVAGMLDLPPTVYRKPRKLKETHNQRRDRADEWKEQFGWDKFDWTKMLA